MTTPIDNPAGRLYQLLCELKELGGFGRDNFRKVFNLENADNANFETICKILETLKLVDDTEEALLQVENGTDVTFFLATLPDIRKVLMSASILALDHPYHSSTINVHLINIVGIAAQFLSSRHIEPIVADEQLTEVLQEVRDLFEDVKSSNLDPKLRVFILRSLRQIENAIQHFRITGVKGLEDALIHITGELYYRQRDVAKATEDSANRDWLDRFRSVIGKVDALIRFSDTGMKALTAAKAAKSSLMTLLGSGSST